MDHYLMTFCILNRFLLFISYRLPQRSCHVFILLYPGYCSDCACLSGVLFVFYSVSTNLAGLKLGAAKCHAPFWSPHHSHTITCLLTLSGGHRCLRVLWCPWYHQLCSFFSWLCQSHCLHSLHSLYSLYLYTTQTPTKAAATVYRL